MNPSRPPREAGAKSMEIQTVPLTRELIQLVKIREAMQHTYAAVAPWLQRVCAEGLPLECQLEQLDLIHAELAEFQGRIQTLWIAQRWTDAALGAPPLGVDDLLGLLSQAAGDPAPTALGAPINRTAALYPKSRSERSGRLPADARCREFAFELARKEEAP